jgi:hypothetical protein
LPQEVLSREDVIDGSYGSRSTVTGRYSGSHRRSTRRMLLLQRKQTSRNRIEPRIGSDASRYINPGFIVIRLPITTLSRTGTWGRDVSIPLRFLDLSPGQRVSVTKSSGLECRFLNNIRIISYNNTLSSWAFLLDFCRQNTQEKNDKLQGSGDVSHGRKRISYAFGSGRQRRRNH